MAGRPDFSFFTPASSEQNSWNTTSTRFYIRGPGGRILVFNFDPAEMKASYSGPDLSSSPVHWRGAEFSFVNPNIVYGLEGGSSPSFERYDLSARGQPTEIHNPGKCAKFDARSYGLDISVSADDNRLLGVFGPAQDSDVFVYVYDLKLGCRWYNTATGEIGGQWGPAGIASTPQRFLIHNARLSKSGEYANISPGGGSIKGRFFWQVGTLNVTICPMDPLYHCGGHHVMGYLHVINKSGAVDDMNLLLRPLSDLTATTPLIRPLPTPPEWGYDGHLSWNNADPEDKAPVCGSTYAAKAPANQVTRAWDNEVICVSTDGKTTRVWRFAHTFTTARNGFRSTPRGNVSQDGRFYMFTSDWQDTLGLAANGKDHRTDVFLVELK